MLNVKGRRVTLLVRKDAEMHFLPLLSSAHILEFRLQGIKINGENNTQHRHIVIQQEKKGVVHYSTCSQTYGTLVSYFIRCTPGY